MLVSLVIQLEVERLEKVLPLAIWTTLRPRYTKAIKEATAAIARRDLRAALASIRHFRAELQRAYGNGNATPRLELDVLLRRLEEALTHGSISEATAAFDQMRCRHFKIEQALNDALDHD